MNDVEKIIEGFDNYSITKDGVVTNLKTGKVLSVVINSKGYRHIGLMKNGKRSYYGIHRLLAIHFIPNPENKPQVNHISGRKTDNRLENLEWCTAQENSQHANDNGLRSSDHLKKVVFNTETGIFYDSVKEAAKVIGYSNTYLTQMLNGTHPNKTTLRYA